MPRALEMTSEVAFKMLARGGGKDGIEYLDTLESFIFEQIP